MDPKFIFVTGGVVSSLGKGITAASLGRLLKCRGLRVCIQKFDPYINVDPGTMNPYQHGEVFVTDDGAETDLDLGHYERFIDENLTQASNVTSGRVYTRPSSTGSAGANTWAPPFRSSRTSPTKSSATSWLWRAPRHPAGCDHHRNRRHRGRHRKPALSGGRAPDARRGREGKLPLPACDAGAVPQRGGRAENQAVPAQRARAQLHRHFAGHPGMPRRP